MVTPLSARRNPVPAFALVALLAGALVFFGWLASQVMQGRTMALDLRWRAVIHGYASPVLTLAMRCVTVLGSTAFGAAVSALLFLVLWRGHHRREGALILITGAGAAVLDQVLKRVFDRPRPEPFFGIERPGSWSFPSGHSLFSLAFCVLLAWLLAPGLRGAARVLLWAAAVALAGTIGFSRVYLGVHWPTDVLGGFAVGIAWVAAVTLGDRWGRWRQPDRVDPAYLKHLRSDPA